MLLFGVTLSQMQDIIIFYIYFFKLRAVAVSPVFQLVPVLLDGSPEYQCTHCFPQLEVFYEIYVDVFCPVAQVICKDI